MIINTGCRTDIPAFFSNWFYNRIEEGYVCVRNPYFPAQVTKYILNPDVVDCIAFCTKNPGPMISRMHQLDAFGQFWFVTILPYEKDIEPNVPSNEQIIDDFKNLSNIIGAYRVEWRYDPVFINETYTLNRHIEAFEHIASRLCGYTRYCVISFIDLYEKTKRNFNGIRAVSRPEREIIGQAFAEIGSRYNIRIKTCVEGQELSRYGVDCTGCMTKPVLERALGKELIMRRSGSIRRECECLLGHDIGVYNSCSHGCIYCYANYSKRAVESNIKNHFVNSPLLIGVIQEGDIVKQHKQIRFTDDQKKLF